VRTSADRRPLGWETTDDIPYGNVGNDSITGGDGTDYLYSGDDNDTVHLTDGRTDYTDRGNGAGDVATDRDVAYDTTLTACEVLV
jgi:Ca2+-binding RTX toxin-like protein